MKFSQYNIVFENHSKEYILFNSLTGNIFQITSMVAKAIESNEISNLPTELISPFIQAGILIDDDKDEHKIVSYFFNKSKFNSIVLSATILLTLACNFRCKYCYEGAGEISKDFMDEAMADSIIEFLKKRAQKMNVKYIYIMLFGGEPLLNFKIGLYIVESLRDFCQSNGMIFSCGIITNGFLLSKSILDKLESNYCKMIQITVDGPFEVHNARRPLKDGGGTYTRILQNLILLENYKDSMQTIIRINVDKTNKSGVSRLLQDLKAAGIKNACIDFGIIRESDNACEDYTMRCFSEEELTTILPSLWEEAAISKLANRPIPSRRWTYCGLYNDNAFTISPMGEVYKCWEMVGDLRHRIGKLDKDGSMIDIPTAFFDWMAIDPVNENQCGMCKYLPVCGGGCRMISYRKYNNYHAAGCAKIKGLIERQCLNYIQTKL